LKAKKLFQAIENISDKYIEEAAPQSQYRKRPLIYAVATLASLAAVICFVVFGNMFLNPPIENNNVFSVKAYAMEQQSGGSAELRELDLINMSNVPGGYLDGKYLYLNVGLKCEGENIKKVDFSAEDGFFAKQCIKRENGKIVTENIPTLYVDENKTLMVYGNYFEKVGEVLTLDKEMITDDLLIFIGKENVNIKDVSEKMKMTIHALATFNDGKTQEQTITLDYSNVEAVIVAGFTEEDMTRWNMENADWGKQYKNDDTVSDGRIPDRPTIGVAMRDVDANEAKQYGLPMAGVVVMEVIPSSNAQRAGICQYDVIIRCNAKDVKSAVDINNMCNNFKHGETITLSINRYGVEMDIDVTLNAK